MDGDAHTARIDALGAALAAAALTADDDAVQALPDTPVLAIADRPWRADTLFVPRRPVELPPLQVVPRPQPSAEAAPAASRPGARRTSRLAVSAALTLVLVATGGVADRTPGPQAAPAVVAVDIPTEVPFSLGGTWRQLPGLPDAPATRSTPPVPPLSERLQIDLRHALADAEAGLRATRFQEAAPHAPAAASAATDGGVPTRPEIAEQPQLPSQPSTLPPTPAVAAPVAVPAIYNIVLLAGEGGYAVRMGALLAPQPADLPAPPVLASAKGVIHLAAAGRAALLPNSLLVAVPATLPLPAPPAAKSKPATAAKPAVARARPEPSEAPAKPAVAPRMLEDLSRNAP